MPSVRRRFRHKDLAQLTPGQSTPCSSGSLRRWPGFQPATSPSNTQHLVDTCALGFPHTRDKLATPGLRTTSSEHTRPRTSETPFAPAAPSLQPRQRLPVLVCIGLAPPDPPSRLRNRPPSTATPFCSITHGGAAARIVRLHVFAGWSWTTVSPVETALAVDEPVSPRTHQHLVHKLRTCRAACTTSRPGLKPQLGI